MNLGIIGCGYWGPNLIRNFDSLSSVDLKVICDLDEERLELMKKDYSYVKITKDYNEILEDQGIDAVVIATPVFKHYEIAKKALLSNKHVLIEKPMASTVEEAKELVRIAQEKNKILMVDHTFEYSEAINKMKEIIDSGELGRIFYIRAEWLNLGLLQPDINVIWDLAPHIISIINYTTGLKPLSLTAKAEGYLRKEIPEIAQVQIKFEKNISAYLTFGWLEPKKTRTITVVGSKKLLVYDLTNSEEPIKIYDKSVEMIHDPDIRQPKMNYKYGDTFSPSIKNIEPLKKMCSHFVDSILSNRKARSSGESGLEVVKVLEATDKSIQEGGKRISLGNDW